MQLYHSIPSPCFVIDEIRLRRNLALLRSVSQASGVEIILAFKAFALWRVFPILREYIDSSTASSLAEAQLAYEEMGRKAHTYAPAYSEKEFDRIMHYSSHITFNSLSQWDRFYSRTQGSGISCGLRINPEYSEVETELYNPCAPGSRLGITADQLGDRLPEGVEGIHFHTLCESNSFALEKTLLAVDNKFGHLLNQARWLNMGGGHLITREGYNVDHLIMVLQAFRAKYPHLHLILEPGSAFVWRAGELVSTVIDIVDNKGIQTALLDVSFSCHMPDCLEMPYKPTIKGATEPIPGKPTYRMGGSSCLAGDYIGSWSFDEALQVGDTILFEDMIHYTMVKTTMFNGVTHPSIGLITKENNFVLLKKFDYQDYKNRVG